MPVAEEPVSATGGFLVTFASGKQDHIPAADYQETSDRHWFFRGGVIVASFKHEAVREVVSV